MNTVTDPDCICGHARSTHEHMRAGSDCGACGRIYCYSYRRANWLRRLLGMTRRARSGA